jgi:glycosyltransferase involved in cell wall biosynthesis
MTNVLFLAHDSGLKGGAQRSLFDLLSGFDRAVIAPTLVAPGEGPMTEAARAIGVPTYTTEIKRWVEYHDHTYPGRRLHLAAVTRDLRGRAAAIASIIERHEVGVVYTNTITCIEGALAARLTRRPHVWHVRESIQGNSSLRAAVPVRVAHALVDRLADHIIWSSRFLADRGYPMLATRKRTSVVYNGIDTVQLGPNPCSRPEWAEVLGIALDTQIVACVGHLLPVKDQIAVVHAAALLKKSGHHNVCFLLVGDGDLSYRKHVIAEVGRLGLCEMFRILGWRDDIDKLLPAVDVLISASRQESFGRTVVEAMACAVPVVSTRCGGPEEIVVDGRTGYLVSVDAPAQLAGATARLLDDPGLARRLGKAGRRHVERQFGLRSYRAGVQRIILKAAGVRATTAAVMGFLQRCRFRPAPGPKLR